MSKIVIVGGNHAGTAAINTILGSYPGNEVEVFEANTNTSFLGCGMAMWIGNQTIGAPESLFYSSPAKLEEAGANVHVCTEVTGIDFDTKTITYAPSDRATPDSPGASGTTTYDKLILSTGSLPIIPNLPGKDLENVQQVKLYQDAQVVIDKLEANPDIEHVTVVGAGYIGVELAEAFERHGKKVAVVDIAPTCLAGYYDEEFSAKMAENLKEHGLDCKFGQAVQEILGDGTKVTGIKTDKEEFATDMVILAIGFRPNNALGKDRLDLFRNGAYVVNKKQETSEPDVYAVGDCATVYDNAIRDVNYIALATNAVRSGIVAAHNACGTPLESAGVQGSNGICIFGYKLISTGITLAKAGKFGIDALATDFEDWQKPGFIPENEMVKFRIVYEKGSRRILGMQCASTYDMSNLNHMFSLAIQEGITIDKLKLLDIFFLPHFNQPYNYITMAALGAE